MSFSKIPRHTSIVSRVSFSSNSSYLALGSRDRTISLWNCRTWTKVGRFGGREDWMTSVAFSRDGKHIASCSHDGIIRLRDVDSRAYVGISPKTSSSVYSVSFTGDGERIVSGCVMASFEFGMPVSERKRRRKSRGILLGWLELQSVKMGRVCPLHRGTELRGCRMRGLGIRSGGHW